MQRREFLKKALAGAGALAFSGWSLQAASSPLWAGAEGDVDTEGDATQPLCKSIMWGTVGMEGSVLDKCRAIKAAGYDGIEPNSHMNRDEVLSAVEQTGLVVSSVCNIEHWSKPLSHPDAAVRQEGIEAMIVAMEDAKAYGTDAVLLVPGVVSEEVPYDACWERSTECIKKLVPVAEKLKVKICLENVWNNFLLSPIEACSYIDQFKSPYVRFYFDCGNILVYGWPEQWIPILGKRIGRIHIKEFSREIADREGRWNGFNVKLTEGNVNWAKVMEQIRKHYRGGWLTTEQGGGASPEELQDLCARLDRIFEM